MTTFYKIAYKFVGAGIIAAGYYAARESGNNIILWLTFLIGIATFTYKVEDEPSKRKRKKYKEL